MAQTVKNPPAMQETWVRSLDWQDPWRMEWVPTPIELPGEFMDRGAWQATVHGVAKSQTRLSDFHSLHSLIVEKYHLKIIQISMCKLQKLWDLRGDSELDKY